MRSACLSCLLLFLMGCGTLVERTPFQPTDDLVTTTPRTLVEAGHSVVISPPAGAHFTLELQTVRETPRQGIPAQYYELMVTVACDGAVSWKADVHGIELVDDEGSTLSPSKILRRRPISTQETTTSHLLIFDLPLSYQPRRIARVTIHWALVAPQRLPIRISSRFRR